MKFMAICGSGLGSSFMVEMNINKVLGELGVSGVEVEHSDVSSAHPGAADVFFLARDIADGLNNAGFKTRKGDEWQAMSVKRVLDRIAALPWP